MIQPTDSLYVPKWALAYLLKVVATIKILVLPLVSVSYLSHFIMPTNALVCISHGLNHIELWMTPRDMPEKQWTISTPKPILTKISYETKQLDAHFCIHQCYRGNTPAPMINTRENDNPQTAPRDTTWLNCRLTEEERRKMDLKSWKLKVKKFTQPQDPTNMYACATNGIVQLAASQTCVLKLNKEIAPTKMFDGICITCPKQTPHGNSLDTMSFRRVQINTFNLSRLVDWEEKSAALRLADIQPLSSAVGRFSQKVIYGRPTTYSGC